jgi:hypothetical protein
MIKKIIIILAIFGTSFEAVHTSPIVKKNIIKPFKEYELYIQEIFGGCYIFSYRCFNRIEKKEYYGAVKLTKNWEGSLLKIKLNSPILTYTQLKYVYNKQHEKIEKAAVF